MAFDDLKRDLLDADAIIRSYVKNSDEYVRLKIFKILMRSITSFLQIVLIGGVVLITFLLLSLAASFGIGQAVDNLSYGFLIVGFCYMVIGIVCYLFREKLNRPLIRRFSTYYFEKI